MSNAFTECGGFMCSGGCDSIAESLCENVGRVIIVFTNSGGASGCGFTGLLVCANDRFVKLITTLPSAPPHPFAKGNRGPGWGRTSSCGCSRFGTSVIIPTDHIVSFVFAEV